MKHIMAQFKGTIKEFTKYVGAFARIKVMHIAKKYKQTINCCEECGANLSLEVAHLKEKERPVLIAKILSEYMDGKNCIDIDLNEFEERFISAHLPLESCVRILCRSCHKDYDRKIKPEISSNISKDEDDFMEKLATDQMNKSKAIELAFLKNITTLTNSNTIFSNILGNQDKWWLEPHNEKFKELLHIILNNDQGRIYIFQLPANTISKPEINFKQRNDMYRKNCSDIYIPVSNSKFTDVQGFDFTKFLIQKIDY